MTSKEIARELSLSPRTVDHHISACIKTLGVPNRTAAVGRLEDLKRSESRNDLTQINAEPSFMLTRSAISLEPEIIEMWRRPMTRRVLPPLGGRTNTASRSQRIAWMTRIFILAVMTTSAVTLSILAVVALSAGLK